MNLDLPVKSIRDSNARKKKVEGIRGGTDYVMQ